MRSPTLALAAACLATVASAFNSAPLKPATRWTAGMRTASRPLATSVASATATCSLTVRTAMGTTIDAPAHTPPMGAYLIESCTPTDAGHPHGATKAAATAETDLQADPSADASKNPMVSSPRGILDPALIETIQYTLGGHKEPVLREFFDDYSSAGPMGAMKHMGTPGVASRLAALMAEATLPAHASCSSRGVGWCR